MPHWPRGSRSAPGESRLRGGREKRWGRRCPRRTTSLQCFEVQDVRQLRESEPRAATSDRTNSQLPLSSAWRFLSDKSRTQTRRRKLAGLDGDQAVLDFVGILEKSPFWRARRARAVTVVSAAMARAHEQAGLWKPPHGAAQVRTVDGKNLKLIAVNAAHPARRVHGLAVGRHHIGIPESSQARLAFRKFADLTERYPGKVGVSAAARDGRKQEAHNRHCEGRCHQAVEDYSDLHE